MSSYTTGTVDFTNGSATITGTGTAWLNAIFVGDLICKTLAGPFYEILAVASDTSITVDRAYAETTAAGSSYYILKISSTRNTTVSLIDRLETLIATYGETPATVTGTANAIVLDSGITFGAYATSQNWLFQATLDNTGATTINPDGLGVKSVVLPGEVALSGGEIRAGGFYKVTYDAAALSSVGALVLTNASFQVDPSAIGKSVISAADAAEINTLLSNWLDLPNINGGPLGGLRNKIINGDFQVWQRGISLANPTFCADRWLLASNGTGYTQYASRNDIPLGYTTIPGNPNYYTRIERTGAGSGETYSWFLQRIEGVRTLAGKTATLTLYARSSTHTQLPSVAISQNFGTGGSPSAAVLTYIDTNIAVGTTFSKIQYKIEIPSIDGKTSGSDNNDFFEVLIGLPQNETFVFDFAHISIVEGDATNEVDPFSPRHIQQELALCHRYSLRWSAVQYGRAAIGYADSSANVVVVLNLPVPLRANPNIGISNLTANGTAISSAGLAAMSANIVQLNCASSGLTTGAMYQIYVAASTSGSLILDAEL